MDGSTPRATSTNIFCSSLSWCFIFLTSLLLVYPSTSDRPFPPPPIERSAEAVLSEGNVEPYLPNEWTEEEAGVLAHLVGLYGPTNWAIIAAGVATKSETQVTDGRGKRKR